MRVTINQIAEIAQVSKGTVSKALNGNKGVGQATRERILALAKMLDFQPDSSARALALQKTGIIGLLIPHESAVSLAGNYWPLVLSGCSQRAVQLDMNLLVLTLPREGDIQGAINQIMKRNTVDGLIIGSELLDKESFSQLVLSRLPFVLLGQNPDFQHYCVDVDSTQGTDLLMRHLLSHGYRRIGALFGPRIYPYTRERYAGYLAALDREGIEWRAAAFSDYTPERTAGDLKRLLDEHPDMDSLYIGSGGQFFMDALAVLKERGLAFPDFGLGTYDDYPYLDFMVPRVTAVRQPAMEAGTAAVDLLERLIDGEEGVEAMVRLENTLIPRDTCGEHRG